MKKMFIGLVLSVLSFNISASTYQAVDFCFIKKDRDLFKAHIIIHSNDFYLWVKKIPSADSREELIVKMNYKRLSKGEFLNDKLISETSYMMNIDMSDVSYIDVYKDMDFEDNYSYYSYVIFYNSDNIVVDKVFTDFGYFSCLSDREIRSL